MALIYLLCSEYKRLNCKARAIHSENGNSTDLLVTSLHNHPPKPETALKIEFVTLLKQFIVQQGSQTPLKGIYHLVAEVYPEIARFYSYVKLAPSMRRWRQLAQKGKLK